MKVKIVLSMLVLATGLMVITDAHGQVITSVVRSNGGSGNRTPIGAFDGNTQCLPTQEGGFKDGNHVFSDRDYLWASTPTDATLGPLSTPLIGAEYVRTFNTDKGASGVQYAVTISTQATVFVTVDNRFNPMQTEVDLFTDKVGPAGTFKDTEIDVHVGGDGDPPGRPLSIFAAELGPGTYIFDAASNTNNFYVIGAVAGDPTFNPPPTVDAKPDGLVAIYKEESLQLGATVTDRDPEEGEPGVLSWQWSKLRGPGTATFSDVLALDPTVTFSVKGNYDLVLTATDGTKDANDIVNVLVLDHADDKMIAHWEFDVTNGPHDVMDSVHNNDGDFVRGDANGLPEYVDGWIGSGALSFPGDGYVAITVDSNSVPNFTNEPRTGASLSAWVKVNAFDQTWQTAVSRGDDSWRIARSSRSGDSGNSMAFHVSGTTTNPANGPSGKINVNDGLWHHVAGTYNGKAITFYVDGVLDVTQPASGMVNLSSNPIVIGGQIHNSTAARREWNGLVDDVRVYNYGLSEAEVLALTAMGQVAPMVNAGADQAVQYRPNEKVSLAGSVIDNGTPGPLTITWATESGPDGAQAIFDDAGSAVTQVSFPKFGTYVLSLTGENSVAAVTDTVQIEVISPTCADVLAEGKALAGDIGGPNGLGGDNRDCRVDLYDIAWLAQAWLTCNDPAAVECEYPY